MTTQAPAASLAIGDRIPTPEELYRIKATAYQQAFPDEDHEAYDDDYPAHLTSLAAVRDAVLEGAAEEAEHSMIGYGASNDEGQEVADWLRSLKGGQP